MIGAFFTGLFLFNSLPHLIKGITGQTHMTPIKKGSSAYLNIVWAFANITLSIIIANISNIDLKLTNPNTNELLSFLVGGFFISMADAQLFSKPNAKLPWHKD